MGNIKQKFIKAGTSYNYAEGVKVLAAEAIKADQIVYVSSSSGPFLKVTRADCNTQAATSGRLLIAKHDIPSGGYGVCLPWKLVTSIDTSSKTAGDIVYLGDSPGAVAGDNIVLAAPVAGSTGHLVLLGKVTVAATVANGGAILVNASAAEKFQAGPRLTNSTAAPAATVIYHCVLATANTDITIPYPMILCDAVYVQGGGSNGTLTVKNGTTNVCITCSAGGGDTEVERAITYLDNYKDFAAGATMRITRASGQVADIAIITMIPA